MKYLSTVPDRDSPKDITDLFVPHGFDSHQGVIYRDGDVVVACPVLAGIAWSTERRESRRPVLS